MNISLRAVLFNFDNFYYGIWKHYGIWILSFSYDKEHLADFTELVVLLRWAPLIKPITLTQVWM